ncbi:MAG: periplasmic heavy metal sensor [Candidatus Margulisiibacteriota bacterium]
MRILMAFFVCVALASPLHADEIDRWVYMFGEKPLKMVEKEWSLSAIQSVQVQNLRRENASIMKDIIDQLQDNQRAVYMATEKTPIDTAAIEKARQEQNDLSRSLFEQRRLYLAKLKTILSPEQFKTMVSIEYGTWQGVPSKKEAPASNKPFTNPSMDLFKQSPMNPDTGQ